MAENNFKIDINSNLREEYERLKSMFQCPRLFLSNYFTDLKAEIDSAYALKESELITDKTLLNKNWIETIKRVEAFEAECFKAKKKNEFNKEFQQAVLQTIAQIEDDLTKGQDLIAECISKIEKELFMNKTITFLDESKTELDIFDELDLDASVGKLLIVNNQYFSSNELKLIKQ